VRDAPAEGARLYERRAKSGTRGAKGGECRDARAEQRLLGVDERAGDNDEGRIREEEDDR